MGKSASRKIIETLLIAWGSFWGSTVGKIIAVITILAGLKTLGVLASLVSLVSNITSVLYQWLTTLYFNVPLFVWLAIGCCLTFLFYHVFNLSRYLSLVAGEFRDDFREGLGKWNYDGEGWLIERDDETPVLSVMNSADGGITQTGLWDCFSFSFENKILDKGKIGWLVKARDRSNYMMLQLIILEAEGTNSEKGLVSGVYIRPHFRYEGNWVIWPHERLSLSNALREKVNRYIWFRVDIRVRGNTVDVYLEGEHTYHLYLDDPLRVEKIENLEYQNEQGQKIGNIQSRKLNVFSYSQGRVGFRCAPTEEHAHIRNVRVRPIW